IWGLHRHASSLRGGTTKQSTFITWIASGLLVIDKALQSLLSLAMPRGVQLRNSFRILHHDSSLSGWRLSRLF
ncbi:hypothetical protein, partial [Cyclobacterium qasimii]|uniref:hypothetical protein n=1 Tax=Cyclobacterium qasimii TaxID=1350429 RepID=UPI001F2304B3